MTQTESLSTKRTAALWRLVEPFLGLLVVLIYFALSPVGSEMFTGGSWKVILVQTVIIALGALGMTLIIVSGGIDLSAGSVVALTSVVGATLILKGLPLFAVLGLTMLSGALIGLVNGALIAGLRMVPFIVTLGMMGIARGLSKWIADSKTVNYAEKYPEHAIQGFMARKDAADFFPLPPGVWLTIALALMMVFLLRKTVFGRHAFAIGSNVNTAHLCGIHVRLNQLAIYGVGGLFFAIAGLMQLSRINQGDPSIAVGLELEIIAAVVIGGASLSGGTGSILGSMVGALMIGVLKRGTTLMAWPTYVQEIIIGVVIILAVWIDRLRQSGISPAERLRRIFRR